MTTEQIKPILKELFIKNKENYVFKKEQELIHALHAWVLNYQHYIENTLTIGHLPNVLYLYENNILNKELAEKTSFKIKTNITDYAFSSDLEHESTNTKSKYEKTEHLYRLLTQNNIGFAEALEKYDEHYQFKQWQKDNEIHIKIDILSQAFSLEHFSIYRIQLSI